jgi:NADH-quinone oxidoreductase subunit L
MDLAIKLIVLLPLLAAAIAGLFCRIIGDRPAQIVTCAALLIAAALSIFVFVRIGFGPENAKLVVVKLFTWMDSGTLNVDWSLRVDTLTAVMLIVVTGVSSMVHVYSVGYMVEDPGIPRFMAYLSLFTFFMLMLVTADNLVQLFFGWEGVGLASYLLIGFWYDKPSANAAAMKAFIVNRVGDFGFALGIFAVWMLSGTVNYADIFAKAPEMAQMRIQFLGMDLPALETACLLLFVGAMGKSAQLGLHTWLPDAMEGPTPVSALIHAATMVTAGVFMVCRLSPLFELAPTNSSRQAVSSAGRSMPRNWMRIWAISGALAKMSA